jgi:hypothetical protein
MRPRTDDQIKMAFSTIVPTNDVYQVKVDRADLNKWAGKVVDNITQLTEEVEATFPVCIEYTPEFILITQLGQNKLKASVIDFLTLTYGSFKGIAYLCLYDDHTKRCLPYTSVSLEAGT